MYAATRCLSRTSTSVFRHSHIVRSNYRTISSSALTVERTTDLSRFQNKPANEDLIFGRTFADHMLFIEWNKPTGWGAPRIVPYADLKISPAATALHYALQCFEGMKAYKAIPDESLRLFRPDLNMKRLQNSMARLEMPGHDFDPSELQECIAELVRTDADWVPYGEGYSLYLRPTVIATHPFLGLGVPESMLLYCIASPVGPYFKGGFRPIRLDADSPYVRAWPGGTGNTKVGANYGPTIKPGADASREGYDQVLWLYGEDRTVTEVGGSNIFFCFAKADGSGRKELVTPPLTRGDILPGVTRDSILKLASSWGDRFDVVERFPTMREIQEAANEGRLLEAFGAGTAAVVTPISVIRYEGEDISIPATGDVTKKLWDELTGIQYGAKDDPWGWSVKL